MSVKTMMANISPRLQRFLPFLRWLPYRGGAKTVVAVRFDGRLYFANVAWFEDAVLEAVAEHPQMKYLIVVGDAINEIDASGEEVIHHLVERLRTNGVTLLFGGLKKQVRDVMQATGLMEAIGAEKSSALSKPRSRKPTAAPPPASKPAARCCAKPHDPPLPSCQRRPSTLSMTP
ncbi:sodium-independent anion transporter [Sulfuricystis multivorans]|uniref:sodium-independent anion transporter n=1 Tax=Sulfuricystis multivorans TaxID=2211108 RepID=UPI000F82AF08|nr:sodium-independent anion transporter [Sulfuricystis multivorans]